MSSDRQRRHRGQQQLPPGRHGLSRTFVEANQRERILDAVAEVVSLAGYQAMSVEDVIGAAGVSRRTFYDKFKSKEDAFLSAYDAIAAQLVQRVYAAYESTEIFPDRVLRCLGAFLEFIAEHPHYGDMCIVEVLAAGPDALARRDAVIGGFAELLYQASMTLEERTRPPRLTAETIIGGVYEIVYSRILHGRIDEVPRLLPDLAYSMMLPYIGHGEADVAVSAVRGVAESSIESATADSDDGSRIRAA